MIYGHQQFHSRSTKALKIGMDDRRRVALIAYPDRDVRASVPPHPKSDHALRVLGIKRGTSSDHARPYIKHFRRPDPYA